MKTARQKPNILILWGDDIGWWNISFNNRGQMGYRTPNIDRLANEGAPSPTITASRAALPGRAAFITGQIPIRTGLTKVGLPGAESVYRRKTRPSPRLLKPLGYTTGQFGKNHFGDKDEFLPTDARFRRVLRQPLSPECRGRAREPGLPKEPGLQEEVRSAGCVHSRPTARATAKSRTPGPLTKKRMETIDDEVTARAATSSTRRTAADKPFFLWFNTTAMHFRRIVAEKHQGQERAGASITMCMVAHDENIGKMLNKLDELGHRRKHHRDVFDRQRATINTLARMPVSRRSGREKNTNWDGGWRVPAFVRWPAKFKAGTVLNGIVSHQDRLPTFLAAAGEPDINEKLLNGHKIGDRTYKVHIDGFNMLPYLTGEVKKAHAEFLLHQ